VNRVAVLRRPAGRLGSWFGGVAAVGSKELRGRMRGRRAFVTVTFYVGVLAIFVGMIYLLMRNAVQGQVVYTGGTGSPFLSAQVGQAVFSGILLLETLVVLFLAPAFTTGAISLEREKQTLDLLAVTPIPSLAIVLGKLVSALTWVLILVFSSIPLTAVVFVFGGVGPEDIVRGYLYVLALAIGLGALGLFFSAVARRTQAATILTYFTVLALTFGTAFVWVFWSAMVSSQTVSVTQPAVRIIGGKEVGGVGMVGAVDANGTAVVTDVSTTQAFSQPARPPEAILWFNPFVAAADVICGTDTNPYSAACTIVNGVTGRTPAEQVFPNGGGVVPIPPGIDDTSGGGLKAAAPVVDQGSLQTTTTRDGFWPQSATAWLVLGAVAVLLSVQLVSPTRRWRLLRRPRGRRREVAP